MLSFFIHAKEVQSAELQIRRDGKSVVLETKDLLKHKELVDIDVPTLNYPDRSVPMKAIRLTKLLESFSDKKFQAVRFRCTDGYSGILSSQFFYEGEPRGSIAFLAIEDPKSPWPPLTDKFNPKGLSAGPFYIVWKLAKEHIIPSGYWPYQIESLELLDSLAGLFPKAEPKLNADVSPKVRSGYQIFQQSCMNCHKMNGQGTSDLGPDLNIPRNPTEYFKSNALRDFIKNPESVRAWPSMKMRWSKKDPFTDEQINELIAYLKFMAATR